MAGYGGGAKLLAAVAGGPAREVRYNQVGPGYAETLGPRVRAGRFFDPAEHSSTSRVVVVSEAFARAFLGESRGGRSARARVRRRPRDRGRRRGRSGRAPSRATGALRVPALRAPAVERRGAPRGDGGRARGTRPRRARPRPRSGPGRRGPRHHDARSPHGGSLARRLDAGGPRLGPFRAGRSPRPGRPLRRRVAARRPEDPRVRDPPVARRPAGGRPAPRPGPRPGPEPGRSGRRDPRRAGRGRPRPRLPPRCEPPRPPRAGRERRRGGAHGRAGRHRAGLRALRTDPARVLRLE